MKGNLTKGQAKAFSRVLCPWTRLRSIRLCGLQGPFQSQTSAAPQHTTCWICSTQCRCLHSPFCYGEPGLARRVILAWHMLLRGVKPRQLLPNISSDLITYMTVILLSMYRRTPTNVNGYFFLEMYQIWPLDCMEKYIILI